MGLHLYGVVGADADLPRGLLGRADEEVHTVSDERLAVLVSDVDEEARVGRADLLAHAHALEAVAETCTVVPVQFGVLMPDEETVRRELLGDKGDQAAALLRAFEGLVQLTVTARYDDEEAALREVVRRDPALQGRPADDVQSKMRLGEAVAAALEELRAEDADVVVQRLSPHARAVAFNEKRDAYTATSMALLVARKERVGLDRAVADLRRELGSRLTLRYVGPQPPYAFLESVDTEASAWG